ncbi:glycosyltransferase family 25 protein [Azotobacter salinestris]|uniref:glycosyltransferase family 25 protein n=1 Tax=Azotobacter salinestris TaxID=69964 RepID=UPI0032DE41E5
MSWPFDFACVINLDGRPDRWARMEASLRGMGVQAERFSAVSLHNLEGDPPSTALREFLLRADGESPGFERKLLGTWACMRSHLGVIAKARDNGWPAVLIMEDDCEFEPYAQAVLRRVQAQLQGKGWDMLYLGGTFKKGGTKRKVAANLLSVTRMRLTHAYMVKAELYERILAEAPLSGLPLDWYYSEVLLPEVRGLMVKPTLARQRLMDMSDIEQVARKPKFKSRQFLERLLARIRYT